MPELGVADNTAALRNRVAAAEQAATTATATATAAQADATTARAQAAAAQAALAANTIKVQRSVVTTPALTIAASIAEVAVTWSAAFADTNYSIIVTPWVSASTVGKWVADPKAGSQTTTGCTLIVSSLGVALAAGQTLDVLAVHA